MLLTHHRKPDTKECILYNPATQFRELTARSLIQARAAPFNEAAIVHESPRPGFRMPRLLIDVTRLLYRRLAGVLPTGIDRTTLAYMEHFGDDARAILTIGPFDAVLSPADSQRLFARLRTTGAPLAGFTARIALQGFFAWWWMNRDVRDCFLLDTSHLGLERRSYAMLARARGARPVFLVHDLIPLTHPQFCRPGEDLRHRQRLANAAHQASGIVTNSRHTLELLRDYCRTAGWPAPPALSAPLASALATHAPGPPPMRQPYFVMLGTIEPRKNHVLVLSVWQRLIETLGDAAPRLMIIGQRGWDHAAVTGMLAADAHLRGLVEEHGFCSDAEVTTALAHARALLFPSFTEGYGLPLAEALSLGVPVIASDLPAFREIAADIPEYADPTDASQWQGLILDYARDDSAARLAQLRRMAAFKPSSWTEHFALVDAFLERLGTQPA